jgi:hypothetical protein
MRASLLFLVACGSHAVAPAAVAPAPERVQPSSPDELVRALLAASYSGDPAALDRIIDPDAIQTAACQKYEAGDPEAKKTRDAFARRAKWTKGTKLELVGIASDHATKTFAAGDQTTPGCTAKVALAIHDIAFDVDTTFAGAPPYRSRVDVQAIDVGGAWYVLNVGMFPLLASRLCTCTDVDCVTKVRDAYAHVLSDQDPPDPDSVARASAQQPRCPSKP